MQDRPEYARHLSDEAITDLKGLEKEFSTTVLAYSHQPVPAELSAAQIEKLQQMEKKLSVRLVACVKQ